jgi:hypothetical protein
MIALRAWLRGEAGAACIRAALLLGGVLCLGASVALLGLAMLHSGGTAALIFAGSCVSFAASVLLLRRYRRAAAVSSASREIYQALRRAKRPRGGKTLDQEIRELLEPYVPENGSQ